MDGSKPGLLSLPYDIRHLIYQHLFPREQQIYIQAFGNELRSILPEWPIPTEVLSVCRQINHEASEYLYNGYLFNVIGTKKDCLANYERFLTTLRKHGRYEPRIDAFTNGEHSTTMCISLQAGSGKVDLLQRRRRGQPTDIRSMQLESTSSQRGLYQVLRSIEDWLSTENKRWRLFLVCGVVNVIVTCVIAAIWKRW